MSPDASPDATFENDSVENASAENASSENASADTAGSVLDVSGAVATPDRETIAGVLSSMLSDAFETFYIVGSRSEANDLALRIARYSSGGKGVIATRNAYHGATVETAAVSPAVGGLAVVAGWSRLVEAPTPDCSIFAGAVRSAAYELRDSEYGFAALIVDPAFVSDGVHTAHGLDDAAGSVREAGGLLIVDEGATTVGSTGAGRWIYRSTDIIPDLLTADFTAVSGVPFAIVAVRPGIDAARAVDPRGFAGTDATLSAIQRVIADARDEEGAESGNDGELRHVGEYLVAGMQLVASATELVTAVRGNGMLVGIDSSRADVLQSSLRDRGVLTARAGINGGTVVISVPHGFSTTDADSLIERTYAAILYLEKSD